MRKWLYLILDHRDSDRVGLIEISETHSATTATKNEVGYRHKLNKETGERWKQKEVGLGCADFEDEDDYEDRVGDVISDKLDDIDDEYLAEAGLEPEVTA